MTAHIAALAALCLFAASVPAAEPAPKDPRFSIDYMDQSVAPGQDFFHYAAGTWIKNNPVPADKARWGAFMELRERDWYFIHEILDTVAAAPQKEGSPEPKVRDFYLSAMDTQRREQLGFKPLDADLKKIDSLRGTKDLLELLADFHQRGISACFGGSVSPDARNSSVYAFHLGQGGLGMPDRDYYLQDSFVKQREEYVRHVANMLVLLGEDAAKAKTDSETVMSLETELAKASKTRVELRDPVANYHKFPVADLVQQFPDAPLTPYLKGLGQDNLSEIIINQPEYLQALYTMGGARSLDDWKTYLRWHLVNSTAPYLNAAAEAESFAFHGKVLSGQKEQEPLWKRAALVMDGEIGEALGQLFVAKHFPPAAKVRMNELVENLKVVFKDHLQKLDWMTGPTRVKALAKFDRFTQKIGHPDKFRDYSAVVVKPDDYLGNVQRAQTFESKRELARVGRPVDKTEWHMTPQTVNAYFNPLQNEIVFPAGILQPPFFDLEIDDAVNYGSIGTVIGHEITHGFDDQGRKYDGDGNLNDWWSEADAKAFEARAEKIIAQYDSYEVLSGLHVNGKLTLGENIADLGGVTIAYEALQRALAKHPEKKKTIDGFTPEQRFFIAFSQLWRGVSRDAETRRLITIDPHSPMRCRAIGAPVNVPEFYSAFKIRNSDPMWRAPELRARIW